MLNKYDLLMGKRGKIDPSTKKIFPILGIIGLTLAVYGIISAIFFANVTWYSYFVIGGTFFLAWINKILKNQSLFNMRIPLVY